MKRLSYFRPLRPWTLALSSLLVFSCGDSGDSDDSANASEGSSSKGPDGLDSVGPDDRSDEDNSENSKTERDKPEPEAYLESIRIEPEDQIILMDLKKTQSVDFKAIGTFSDDEERDISDEVTWELEKPKLGEFDGESLELVAHDEFVVRSSKVFARLDEKFGLGQITLAAYQQSGENPDFLFVLPHKDPEGAKDSNLRFSTKVPKLDVFFNVDTTMSMKDEMKELRTSLRTTIVPRIQKTVKNTEFGVGSFQDFPVDPYGRAKTLGGGRDQPFRLKQAITSDIGKVQQGVNALKLGHGEDVPESALESLYQISTGEGLSGPGVTNVPAYKGKGIGGVGFRKGTMPVIVTITDAVSHAPGEAADGCKRDYEGPVLKVAHTRKQTEDALEKVCARSIYVASAGVMTEEGRDHCTPETDGKALAKATGARVFPAVWNKKRPKGCNPGQCCTGINGVGKPPEADGRCSLVFNVNSEGRGLGNTVVSGIEALAFYAQFDVTLEKKGVKESIDGKKLPDDRTSLDFIASITADKFGKPPLEGLPEPKPSGDHFKDVTPGTEVQFKIEAKNDFLPEVPGEVQVFRAEIKVRADQCEGLALDTREVHFIIPPAPVAPPV